MAVLQTLYRGVFRRTSTFVLTFVIAGFGLEAVINQGINNFYAYANRGKMYDAVQEYYSQKSQEVDE